MMQSKRFKWNSESLMTVLNKVYSNKYKWNELSTKAAEIHRAHHAEGYKAVAWHKAKLGRQKFCWNGEYRYWVWEGKNWRVFVSDYKGIALEIRQGLLIKEQIEAFEDYRNQVGLTGKYFHLCPFYEETSNLERLLK